MGWQIVEPLKLQVETLKGPKLGVLEVILASVGGLGENCAHPTNLFWQSNKAPLICEESHTESAHCARIESPWSKLGEIFWEKHQGKNNKFVIIQDATFLLMFSPYQKKTPHGK